MAVRTAGMVTAGMDTAGMDTDRVSIRDHMDGSGVRDGDRDGVESGLVELVDISGCRIGDLAKTVLVGADISGVGFRSGSGSGCSCGAGSG